MSGGLDDLYQDLILDHGKRPRNFGVLEPHSHHADGYNPLCGDKCNITAVLDGDVIVDIKFDGVGCAISTASASMMTGAVKGHTVAEADALFHRVHDLLTNENPVDDEDLGKLAAFHGVRRFPMRVKCASLPWHTLEAALHRQDDTVTTE